MSRPRHAIARIPEVALPDKATATHVRPAASGKFLVCGGEKLYVKGVTYGAFLPDGRGREYQDFKRIDADFAQMRANGFNAVRIPHTMPPRSLLDTAQRHGLRVMVSLSAEQFVGYLLDRKEAPDIEKAVWTKVQSVADHPALLCYAIGNEIPAAVARWLGRRRVERYLHRIHRLVKQADPSGLVTYVNYPSTEYLDLPFLDFVSFNVYLESPEPLKAYLARLQNIVGDRPLVMSEVGLDSLRNGEIKQAEVLEWQIRTAFAGGCAGAFVFSWTDEWGRAGKNVDDWEFGITRRDRSPKRAVSVVREALSEIPFPPDLHWPRISVVVCSFNGGRTIRECLWAISKLRYANIEVIVVDDGSTDNTAEIAAQFRVNLIRTSNHGLSHARNVGWRAASGEIVAYIDDDAYPDPDWLRYLADMFQKSDYVGIGGPNIPPTGDGPIAACVASSPGGPVHVLLTDTEAEHIPGCNMAFRRSALEAIGGFDQQFRVAGDDVDICWRLQERGWKVGFSPSAQVWHHRRNSVRAFWRQQKGYGKAEALLEKKWPEKYNSAGHVTWCGRVYSPGRTRILGTASRIYHGQWGTAPFQSLHDVGPGHTLSLLLTPEWYLVDLILALIAVLGIAWRPLFLALPLLAVSGGFQIANACVGAARCSRRGHAPDLRLWMLTAFLHLMQPAARLYGRLVHGLSFWRRRPTAGFIIPRPREIAVWTERWEAPERRLEKIEADLRRQGIPVQRGGGFDEWDLEIRGGFWGGARLLMAVEDHGAGSQFVRSRIWPRFSTAGLILSLALVLVSLGAGLGAATSPCILSAAGAFISFYRTIRDSGGASATLLQDINKRNTQATEQRIMGAHA